MVAQPGKYQASNNSGELSPEVAGRTDIKQYYGGLSLAINVEPVPQGGSRLSPRSRFIGRIRRALTAIDGSLTLNAGPHTVAAVLATLTFDAAELAVARAPALSATIDTGNILQFEYRDVDAVWHALGELFSAGTDAKARAAACPAGSPVIATGIRLRMTTNPPASVTFTIGTIEARTESDDLSAVRLQPFTFDLQQTYVAVLTAGHADFWRDETYGGAAVHPAQNSQLAVLDLPQRFDTMMLYHRDLEPLRIMRDASDGRWPSDAVPFTNVPMVDLGGTYVNNVVDEWEVRLAYPTADAYANGADLYFKLTINGEETVAVYTATPNWNTINAALQAAILALPGIAPGVTVSHAEFTGFTKFTIRFAGDGNKGHFSVAGAVTNTPLASVTCSNSVMGDAGGEDLFSVSAGYPGCATFYQDRLCLGGFKSKRGAIAASIPGEYFDLNIKRQSANGAVLANFDTDGAETIRRVARGKHLVVFTSDAEYFISDRAISNSAAPNIVNSSRNGIADTVPVVESEGSLLYVARNRALVYAASYDDVAAAYVSDPISLLASHIVADIKDAALQKASAATDARRYWMARDDGSMTVGILIRNQDIVAFVRWQTDGLVKAVCVDGQNRPHIAVERTVGDRQELHLERLELGLIFDGTIEQTFEDPATEIPNLGPHEGATVWAQADGFVVGPFTVTDGKIELANAASHVLVGRWTPPDARTLPLPREIAERTVLRRPARVHTVTVDLLNTTSIAIGANGRPAKDVPLYFAGQPTDAPPPPFTGPRPVYGLAGFSDEGIVQITQTRPGWLQWRGITVQARQ